MVEDEHAVARQPFALVAQDHVAIVLAPPVQVGGQEADQAPADRPGERPREQADERIHEDSGSQGTGEPPTCAPSTEYQGKEQRLYPRWLNTAAEPPDSGTRSRAAHIRAATP